MTLTCWHVAPADDVPSRESAGGGGNVEARSRLACQRQKHVSGRVTERVVHRLELTSLTRGSANVNSTV